MKMILSSRNSLDGESGALYSRMEVGKNEAKLVILMNEDKPFLYNNQKRAVRT